MDAPGFASPIRTYRQNLSKMRESNNPNGSETTKLCLLGVVDLDLTVCPDVFGLRAFDERMPVTRMLPGPSPCELRLLIPDTKIGQDGFHDVVVENLIGSSTWRSRHVSPSDSITPTLAEGRVPSHEGAQCGVGGFTATSVCGTTVGIPIHWARLLPGVRN